MLLVMGVVLLLQTGLITGSIIGSGAIERLSEILMIFSTRRSLPEKTI